MKNYWIHRHFHREAKKKFAETRKNAKSIVAEFIKAYRQLKVPKIGIDLAKGDDHTSGGQ